METKEEGRKELETHGSVSILYIIYYNQILYNIYYINNILYVCSLDEQT